MIPRQKEKILSLMDTIAQDMKNDAEEFDGKPFTGKTMAEYNGNQGAAIAALAEAIKLLVKEQK